MALAQCGDIQTNPGPSNIHRKRINKISFPCSSCQRGIRRRPVICYVCKNLTHSKCIKGLTNDLYDKFYNDNEVIVYKCICCTAKDVANNIKVKSVTFPLPHLPHPLPSSQSTTTLTVTATAPSSTNRTETGMLPTLPASSINDLTQVEKHVICKCCQKVIKKNNKKRSCNNCESIYHPKCYKTVSINDHLCNICLSEELPFFYI